jgi:ubiquinone/menaquinone biosynthesis C-methylase UbiE
MSDQSDGRNAWGQYWQSGGQASCFAGAAAVDTGELWQPFIETLPSGARILDMACGGGALTRVLLSRADNPRVMGVDYAPDLPPVEGAELVRSALESQPFESDSFDAVVSQFGMEYADIDAVLAEMSRMLVPAGRFACLMHHADGAVVQQAAQEIAALADLLAEGGIIHGAVELARVKEAGAASPALEQRVAQTFAAATQRPLTPTRKWALDFFAEMMEKQAEMPPEYLRNNTYLLHRELSGLLTRLEAMRNAAKTESEIQQLVEQMTANGFAEVSTAARSDAAGNVFAWWISGTRGPKAWD